MKHIKQETVLVTGGGGFLGRAIVERLVKRSYRVRSFSRNRYDELERLGVEQIQGDIRDRQAVMLGCKAVDLIFHVAAKPPPWGKYHDYYQTNVVGTENILNGAEHHQVRSLVYTSTPSVVFDGKDIEGVDEFKPYPDKYCSHYSKTKALAEQRVVAATAPNFKTIILRPHEIWGPGDNHILPRLIARAHRLKRIGNGKNLIDVTYIDDAADAHLLAADTLEIRPEVSGKIYFISQGDPVPAWDMINALLKTVGYGPIVKSVPWRAAWLVGALLELVHTVLQLKAEPYITRFTAKAVAQSHWFDIRAAKRDLGYRPKVSIQEGLRYLAEWMQNISKGDNT